MSDVERMVAFVLAQIADDEAAAQHARWAMQDQWFTTADDKVDEFVQRMSPARVLAECAAKKAIVELFPASGAITDEDGNFHGYQGRDCSEHRTAGAHRAWCFDCSEWCYPADPCVRCHGVHDVLRLLAQPYADRPGWDPAWKVET